MAKTEVYDINISDIKIDEENVRHSGAETELKDLANNIKKHGLLQQIVFRKKPKKYHNKK